MLVLGLFVLGFVALNASRFSLRVKPSWERYLAGPAGLVAGVMGGITNAHGTPLVVYFYALGLDKGEFVRAISLAFIVYKAAQHGPPPGPAHGLHDVHRQVGQDQDRHRGPHVDDEGEERGGDGGEAERDGPLDECGDQHRQGADNDHHGSAAALSAPCTACLRNCRGA
jgi:hypothetical protein